jgi:hypothetical protein
MSESIRRAGLLCITALFCGCARDHGDPALASQVAALRQELTQVRQQAQLAADYIAISNLQAAYGYYSDKALWDQAADLFSRQGTLEISGRGVFVGNDRVRQYLQTLPGLAYGTVFLHMQIQPVIDIAADGRTANGRWRQLSQIGQLGKRSQIGEGIYENAYVKEDGVWKISKLHYYTTYLVNFKDAWFKPGEPLLGPFPDLPPDRPPSQNYPVYPGVYVPPFHYKNPVSGRR